MDKQDLLDQFKQDFQRDYSLIEEQRDKANEDMRFVTVDGGHWENFLEQKYNGRARLEFDLASDYVQRVIGEWEANPIGVSYEADDDATSDDDAELLNGLYRSDFRRSTGEVSTNNAIEEAAKAGVGAYMLTTEYEDEEDAESELQRIVWEPIYTAYNTVVWDCSAQRADKADARHVTIIKEMSRDAFEAKYPDLEAISAVGVNDRADFNWNEKDTIRIAKRYECKTENTTGIVYANPSTGAREILYEDEIEDVKDELEMLGWEKLRERKVKRKYVECSLFYGDGFIEKPRRIAGKYIPVIPIYCARTYVDGQEYFHGLVRKLKDANRLFDMQVSTLAEDAADRGKSLPIFDPEQVQGLESNWNTDKDLPFRVARALRDKSGNIVQAGPVGFDSPPAVNQNIAALIEVTGGYVREKTGGMPQDIVDTDASGKAINAIIKRINLNTAKFRENIKQSMKRAGEVYRWMAAEVYSDRRNIKLVNEDGSTKTDMLYKLVADRQTGRLVEINDISKGKFEVTVSTGPQYETQKDHIVDTLQGLLTGMDPQSPQYNIVLNSLLGMIEGPGMDPVKKFARRQMLTMGLIEPESEEDQQILQGMQQPQSQEELIKAATQRELAEAREADSRTRENEADTAYTYARAEETAAKAMKTKSDMINERIQKILESQSRLITGPGTIQ